MMIKSIVIALLVATIVCQAVAEKEVVRPWVHQEGGIKAQGNDRDMTWGDDDNGGNWHKTDGTFNGRDKYGNIVKGEFSHQEKHEHHHQKSENEESSASSFSRAASSSSRRSSRV